MEIKRENMEWSGHVMKNMTPIKKIVLGLAAMCVAISIITANNLASVMMLIAAKNNAANNAQVVQQGTVQQNTVQQGTVQQGGSTSTGGTSTDTDSTGGASTDTGSTGSASTDTGSTGGASANAGDTKAVVDQYIKAVNKAKSSAKKVTLVTDGAALYNGIFEAGVLTSIGQGLVDQFMKIEEKNEVVDKAKLPPEGINVSFTANDVKSASSKTEGDLTVITIVMKDQVNPKAGSGIGAAVNVIEEQQILEPVEGIVDISNISLAYENVTMIAKVDKSGNLVELNIDAPSVLSLNAAAGPLKIDNAKVGIQIKSLYKIEF